MVEKSKKVRSNKKDTIELCSYWKNQTPRSVTCIVSTDTNYSSIRNKILFVHLKENNNDLKNIGIEKGQSNTFVIWLILMRICIKIYISNMLLFKIHDTLLFLVQ